MSYEKNATNGVQPYGIVHLGVQDGRDSADVFQNGKL